MQIHLMAAISFERYYVLFKTININKMDNKMAIRSIMISIILSLFWTCSPLFGQIIYIITTNLIQLNLKNNRLVTLCIRRRFS
jgi:hypothetical protein